MSWFPLSVGPSTARPPSPLGANTGPFTAHTHTQQQHSQEERRAKKGALCCYISRHLCLGVDLRGLRSRAAVGGDGCCSHPLRIMFSSRSLTSKSLPLALYSESPASRLSPPHPRPLCPFLFIAFRCPPTLLIMFMWCDFPFFISVIHYKLPLPPHLLLPLLYPDDCALFSSLATLSPLRRLKNQLPIK